MNMVTAYGKEDPNLLTDGINYKLWCKCEFLNEWHEKKSFKIFFC